MDEVENWLYDGVSVEIGDMVQVGDNFMIPTKEDNEDGVQYYVLQCQRTKFVLEDHFTCPWGAIFKVEDVVIRGKYYKAIDAHVDVYLVRACKFEYLCPLNCSMCVRMP